jgi:hypothetical protein
MHATGAALLSGIAHTLYVPGLLSEAGGLAAPNVAEHAFRNELPMFTVSAHRRASFA